MYSSGHPTTAYAVIASHTKHGSNQACAADLRLSCTCPSRPLPCSQLLPPTERSLQLLVDEELSKSHKKMDRVMKQYKEVADKALGLSRNQRAAALAGSSMQLGWSQGEQRAAKFVDTMGLRPSPLPRFRFLATVALARHLPDLTHGPA